jgi:protein-S-isoprenylcysteine O-methyltransferase Ste14
MKKREGEHPYGDTVQLVLLGLFLVVWVGDSFFVKASTFLSDYVPLYLRLIVLCLCLAVALWLFKFGHVVVSAEKPAQGLVVTGVFRHVRHPLYLASILTYAGLMVSTLSLLSLALLVLIFAFYDYIAGYEERQLAGRFGQEYEGYRQRTGKWIPKTGGGR